MSAVGKTESKGDHWTALCLSLGRHSGNVITGLRCVFSWDDTVAICSLTGLCLQFGRHSCNVITGLRCVSSLDHMVSM